MVGQEEEEEAAAMWVMFKSGENNFRTEMLSLTRGMGRYARTERELIMHVP